LTHDTWLQDMSDPEEAATLTTALVAHRSYPGEEAGAQRAVAAWLNEHGLLYEMQPTFGDAERPNVVCVVENGPGSRLLLNGHIDTVLAAEGWEHDPWQAQRDGDRLTGLGACDMKSGVVAAMMATRALAQHRDRWSGTVIFTSVVDEEAYSLGARSLIADGISADACIVTEACWQAPCLGAFGKMLLRADVTGRSAHASWPSEGVNAAVEAARFVAQLDTLSLPVHEHLEASHCVLSIRSGNDQYVMTVPELASVLLNRHTVPGETASGVLAEMQSLVASMGTDAEFAFELEPPFYPPWQMPEDDPLVQLFSDAYTTEAGHAPAFTYNGFGDANLFQGEAGIPTLQFGPDGGLFHQANEWVNVPSIGATVRVLLRVALGMMPATS
jgi:acetylornithine deacetylase/succinyl-diaminopimelate desuccinylase-like protein